MLFVDPSINLTASDLLLGSKMYIISPKAALCIKESANKRETKQETFTTKLKTRVIYTYAHNIVSMTFMFFKERVICLEQRFPMHLTT